MVKDETHDRLTSTVSFWSSIGFYSLCSSSMLLVNKMEYEPAAACETESISSLLVSYRPLAHVS